MKKHPPRATARVLLGAFGAAAIAAQLCAQSVPTLDWQVRRVGATSRVDHAMAYLSSTRTSYSFGGADSPTSPPTDAFFAFDGVQHRSLTPNPRPSARRGHTLVEDPLRQRLVLFGGQDVTGALLNDTWEWDGVRWTRVLTAQSPSPRHGHAVEFEERNGRVLLFGGETSVGVDAETWVFDGTSWTQVAGVAPAARRQHVIATSQHATSARVVLFGGDDGAQILGDTWMFDGTTWIAQTPTVSPPPRRRSTMELHWILRTPLLIGGEGVSGELADAWTFTGSTWNRVPAISSGIGTRARHAATYDRARSVVVVHGGTGLGSVSIDEWFDGRLAGQPGTATWFGRSCGGPALANVIPVTNPNRLFPGGAVQVFLAPDPSVRAGVLLLGLDATRIGSFSLPLDLTPIGMPGCTLWIRPDVNVPMPNPPQSQSMTLVIPSDASLAGARFFAQGMFVAPAANAAGLVVSNGVEVAIGFGSGAPSLQGEIAESFADANQLDTNVSSGTWANGSARFGILGRDGAHGAFVADDGVSLGNGVFRWSTDAFTIPATRTVSGRAELVTDGVFRFAEFVLPADRTVVFEGSRPVQIYVRGRVDIRGRVVANGEDLALHSPQSLQGQLGSKGGPGAASGGRGAYMPSGTGAGPLYDGGDGADVMLLAGHAYATTRFGTGGRGSSLVPTSGLNASITFNGLGSITSAMIAAGGGGGGYVGSGAAGVAVFNGTAPASDRGAPAAGGTGFTLLPLPQAIAGTQRLEHFLIGGSGGGGGGGHPFFSIINSPPQWKSGAGGSGGGGAIAFRVGGSLNVASGASIEARGGDGVQLVRAPPPAPGGGGSGGSIVLQVAGDVVQAGTLQVRGGLGGRVNDRIAFLVETVGGHGAPGFARLEVDRPQPPLALIGIVDPPAGTAAVDTLTDRDTQSGFQSKWYWSDLPLLVEWQSVVIDATVGGLPVRFSDVGFPGVRPGPGQPVQLWLQGARFDPATGQLIPGSEGPWRSGVTEPGGSLNSDGATAVRFQLVADRSIAGEVVVQRVTIAYRR